MIDDSRLLDMRKSTFWCFFIAQINIFIDIDFQAIHQSYCESHQAKEHIVAAIQNEVNHPGNRGGWLF